MTRIPISLEDKHTRKGKQRGALVEAFLCVDVPAATLTETARAWEPLFNAGMERREHRGLPPLENPHWNWSTKAEWLSLASYRSLGIECEGVMQGLMLVVIDGYSARMPPDAGKPLVYVDYVQSSPQNNEDLVDHPRFGAIGSYLIEGAARLSIDMEFGGRLGLHSLKRSEGFYEKLGFQRVEVERDDRHARGLWYFEWTEEGANQFLTKRRIT